MDLVSSCRGNYRNETSASGASANSEAEQERDSQLSSSVDCRDRTHCGEIYLVMLHLPEKTVLKAPHPLLHPVAPLLHGLAHHAPDEVPLEDLCRLPGSFAQVGTVGPLLRDDLDC